MVVTCGAQRFMQHTPKQRNAYAALDGRHVATTRRTRSRYGRRHSPIGSHGQRGWPTRGLDAGVDTRHAKNRGAEGEAVTVIYL